MNVIEVDSVPTLKKEIKIEKVTQHKLRNQVKEESQVIVHCTYTGLLGDDQIRIWESTYLYVKNSSHRSELVHAENISMYPTWTSVARGQRIVFTLIFSGLPKYCKQFDMIENIPESGGFLVVNIKRNYTDVYHIDVK